MKKYILPLFTLTLLASGCASSPSASSGAAATKTAPSTAASAASTQSEQQAKAAIAAAEKSQSQAAASGFEWRDTAELIDDAKKAAAAGEYDKAIALAGQAERQGALAVKQSAIETERVSKIK